MAIWEVIKVTICIFSPWRRKRIVSPDLLPLIWPRFHPNTWHSSWWAVIRPEAELTASVRLERQTANRTDLQLRKSKADIQHVSQLLLPLFSLFFALLIFLSSLPWFPCTVAATSTCLSSPLTAYFNHAQILFTFPFCCWRVCPSSDYFSRLF